MVAKGQGLEQWFMLMSDYIWARACRQQTQGLLPQGTNFDLFRGTAQGARDEVERYPTQVLGLHKAPMHHAL